MTKFRIINSLSKVITHIKGLSDNTVEPQIKDTIEITFEQRTRFNVPNGDFPIVLIYSSFDKRQPVNKGRKQWVPNVSVIRRFHWDSQFS